MSEYSYRIEERPAALGGGWRLYLLEDGQEVGGGVFPPSEGAESPSQAMFWAYNEAAEEAENWVNSR